jgi:hypothetical protein
MKDLQASCLTFVTLQTLQAPPRIPRPDEGPPASPPPLLMRDDPDEWLYKPSPSEKLTNPKRTKTCSSLSTVSPIVRPAVAPAPSAERGGWMANRDGEGLCGC